jgi:hypothetical protein
MQKANWSLRALLAGFVVAIAAMLATGAAEAQNTKKGGSSSASSLITANSFDAILAALESNGFTVDLTKDSDGDPLIESLDDDEPFSVHFYGCTKGKDCEYIQFVSGWDLAKGTTMQVIAKWNEDRVWGRAFLDSDNDPWLDLAVNLKGGVTAENFDDTVSWWWSVLRDFEDHIGWTKKEGAIPALTFRAAPVRPAPFSSLSVREG